MLQPLPALLIAGAAIATTFAAACGLVFANPAADVKSTQRQTDRQAASDYRTAHAKCQIEPASTRKGCVIDAHAAEDRARNPASSTPRAERKAGAHAITAMNAADRDGIIVEPACDAATRERQASCEIQVGRDRNNKVG